MLGVLRATVMEGDLHGVLGVAEVEHRDAALIPGLHHDVASRHRNERAVVRNTVLRGGLRGGQLVVALELHLPVLQGEDGVGAPLLRIGRAALRSHATAPLVGEDHLAAVVVERGRVPVREVRVGDGGNADGRRRVPDVEQQAVAFAGAAGVADARVERDVMTLRRSRARAAGFALAHHAIDHRLQRSAERGAVGGGGLTRAATRLHDAVEAGLGELVGNDLHVAVEAHVEGAARLGGRDHLLRVVLVGHRETVRLRLGEVVEDARAAHDRGLLGVRERHLDDFDAEERRVRVGGRRGRDAAGEFGIRTDRRRARDVDVDVLGILRIHEQRMRVRAAAGLHGRQRLRVLDVADVENAESLEALRAHRTVHATGCAVETAFVALTRDEEKVLVRRHVGLRTRAVVRGHQRRCLRIRDVPDLPAVERALEDAGPVEGDVGVDAIGEFLARARGRHEVQVPDRFAGIPATGLETNARIGRRRHRADRLGADQLRGEGGWRHHGTEREGQRGRSQ